MAGELLSNRVALVTGGTGGIGRAAAIGLAGAGAQVAIAGRRRDAGETTVDLINAGGGRARFVQCDVEKPLDIEQMVGRVLELFGRLDIAFNNAGILGEMNAIADETLDNYEHVFNTNVRGTLLCMRAEMRHFVRQNGGVIVNNTSIYGSTGLAGCGAYVAAKHAIEGLTKTAALEGAPHGVRVNAVAPGFVRTDVRAHLGLGEDLDKLMVAQTPMGRIAEADEIANAVVFLAADTSKFVTGISLRVDGGYAAK